MKLPARYEKFLRRLPRDGWVLKEQWIRRRGPSKPLIGALSGGPLEFLSLNCPLEYLGGNKEWTVKNTGLNARERLRIITAADRPNCRGLSKEIRRRMLKRFGLKE